MSNCEHLDLLAEAWKKLRASGCNGFLVQSVNLEHYTRYFVFSVEFYVFERPGGLHPGFRRLSETTEGS